MRKFLSVMLAATMAVSVFAVSVVPAFAVPSPTATTATQKGPTITVNGSTSKNEVTFTPDPSNPNKVEFEYAGEGSVTNWSTNLPELGYVEGVDYVIEMGEDGSLVIIFNNEDAKKDFESGKVTIDAQTEEAPTTVPGETTTVATTKKNDSSKSPNTGVATSVIAGSIAVAGAGIAVLSATKKRDAE